MHGVPVQPSSQKQLVCTTSSPTSWRDAIGRSVESRPASMRTAIRVRFSRKPSATAPEYAPAVSGAARSWPGIGSGWKRPIAGQSSALVPLIARHSSPGRATSPR